MSFRLFKIVALGAFASVAFYQQGAANSAELSCQLVFALNSDSNASSAGKMGQPFPIAELKTEHIADHETVSKRGTILDENGQELIVFEVEAGQSWSSRFNLNRTDLAGDPRSFAFAVGPELAYFFGFRFLSPTQVTVPTAKTFNHYIAKANQLLKKNGKEPIQAKFFVAGQKELPNYNLISALSRQSAVPLSANGHLQIHDLSYHTLFWLLPSKVVKSMQQKIDFILRQNKELLRLPNLTSAQRYAVKYFVESRNHMMAGMVDMVTGNFPQFIMRMNFPERYGPLDHAEFDIYSLANAQRMMLGYVEVPLPRYQERLDMIQMLSTDEYVDLFQKLRGYFEKDMEKNWKKLADSSPEWPPQAVEHYVRSRTQELKKILTEN